jgi:DNA-binding LacI/PurR family transcriptional regulator
MAENKHNVWFFAGAFLRVFDWSRCLTKQSQIIREIEQMIAVGHLRPGQMLPTQKELMGHFGVAMGTVQQALGRLQTRGVVMSTRGKGTTVCDSTTLHTAGITRPRVDLLLLNSDKVDHILIQDTATVIQQTLSEHGFETSMRTQLPESTAALNLWAQQTRAAVVIGYHLPARVIQAMRAAHRPIIIAGELYSDPCPPGVSQVTVSMENIIQLALSCLTSMGHRRIALLRGADTVYYRGLAKAFEHAAIQMGIADQVQQWHLPHDSNGQNVVEQLATLADITAGDQLRPSVLLVDGGQRACRVIYALQRAGLRVPQDIGVFAISGHVPAQLAIPSLSRVETTVSRLGQRLAEVLLEILQQPLVVREAIPPRLIHGDTCQPPSEPVFETAAVAASDGQ